MTRFLLFVLVFFLGQRLDAQEWVVSVYFDTDLAVLKAESHQSLDGLATQVAALPDYEWRIEAYTDDRGSQEYNDDLATRRGDAVRGYLSVKGLQPALSQTIAYGERKSSHDNLSENSRAANRRVDVRVTQIVYNSISEMLAKLNQNQEQQFTIIADQDQTITAKNGTVLVVPAGSLVTLDGQPVTGPVQISITEALRPSDWIANQLPTISNGELIQTRGMVNIEASQNGNPLMMAEDGEMSLSLPTNNQDNSGFQLFYGQHDADKAVNGAEVTNWTTSTTNPTPFVPATKAITEVVRHDTTWWPQLRKLNYEVPTKPAMPEIGFMPALPAKPIHPSKPTVLKEPHLADVKSELRVGENAGKRKVKRANRVYEDRLKRYKASLASYEKRKATYEKKIPAYEKSIANYNDIKAKRDAMTLEYAKRVKIYQEELFVYHYRNEFRKTSWGLRKRYDSLSVEYVYAVNQRAVKNAEKNLGFFNGETSDQNATYTASDNFFHCYRKHAAGYATQMLIKGVGGEVYKMSKADLGQIATNLYVADTVRYHASPSRNPYMPETWAMVPNDLDNYRDRFIAEQVKIAEIEAVQDSIYKAQLANIRDRQVVAAGNGFTIPVADGDSKFMTVKIDKLGWINCDRFGNDPRPKKTLAVHYERSGATVMAYLPKINSMMSMYRPYDYKTGLMSGTNYIASNLPVGEPIKLIIMEVVDGKILLSIQDTKVGSEVIEPNVVEVSKQELQAALEKLNG
jgi:OmpA family